MVVRHTLKHSPDLATVVQARREFEVANEEVELRFRGWLHDPSTGEDFYISRALKVEAVNPRANGCTKTTTWKTT